MLSFPEVVSAGRPRRVLSQSRNRNQPQDAKSARAPFRNCEFPGLLRIEELRALTSVPALRSVRHTPAEALVVDRSELSFRFWRKGGLLLRRRRLTRQGREERSMPMKRRLIMSGLLIDILVLIGLMCPM